MDAIGCCQREGSISKQPLTVSRPPDRVAVPSPLSVNFTPPGRCPVWVIEGIGLPEVVMVKEE